MIAVKGLSKAYGGVRACDDLTLSIAPESTTAVVGPNGAGKSTLVQLLSGVVRPDAGNITLGDRDVTRLSSPHRYSLGVARTFQTARVFPGLNVLDSVLIGAYNGLLYESHPFGLGTTLRDTSASLFQLPSWRARQREAERRALEVIDLFGERLRPRLEHLTFSLSYANRRRVEIARALASRPKLLILDEPTAGMNPTETEELTDLLQSVKRDRPELTVVFVEHKMNVVRRMSERVIVMDAGRVIADGTPEEALNDPAVIDAYLGSGGHNAAHA
jgi:branched-chain amino acid transport system ATP-binding protein